VEDIEAIIKALNENSSNLNLRNFWHRIPAFENNLKIYNKRGGQLWQ